MALPLFRIEIHKTGYGEEWANDYLTDLTTMAAAAVLATDLITFERDIHCSSVLFTYVRISTMTRFDRVFRHTVINLPGLQGTSDSLPLYCTFRLDLGTADSDPARKYYRAPVQESDQTNGVIITSKLTALATTVAGDLTTPGNLTHIVTPKGHGVVSATFSNQIQMRQLHRHKRRRTGIPVIPPS